MTYLFLDTSVLLHCRPLREIDWLRLIDAKEVTLVIVPIVIRELDRHKDQHSVGRIRARARQVLTTLLASAKPSSPSQVREGVWLSIEAYDPQIDFPRHRLNPSVNDDWLLASVIERKQARPPETVMIVAVDAGIELKAPAYQIEVLRPPNEALLPSERDAEDKRLKQLETELNALKKNLPELCLRFGDGKSVLQVKLGYPRAVLDEDIQKDVRRCEEKYPVLTAPIDTVGDVSQMSLGELAALCQREKSDTNRWIPLQEYERYNQEREIFIASYKSYLHDRADYTYAQARSFRFELLLKNDGGRPAEDIDIYLSFPDGFALFNESEARQKPAPPKPPLGLGEFRSLLGRFQIPELRLSEPDFSYLANVGKPEITRSNSYEVTVPVKRLKHEHSTSLGRFTITFDSDETVKSFQIRYRISAGNLPKSTPGSLAIVVERS